MPSLPSDLDWFMFALAAYIISVDLMCIMFALAAYTHMSTVFPVCSMRIATGLLLCRNRKKGVCCVVVLHGFLRCVKEREKEKREKEKDKEKEKEK